MNGPFGVYQCDKCEAVFVMQHALQGHINKVHNEL